MLSSDSRALRATLARSCRRSVAGWLVLMLAGAMLPAQAHKASDAYLQLQRDGDALTLRWDIALRDLDAALELDRDGDRQLRWGEVRARMDDIRAYALARLRLQQGRCSLAAAQAPAVEDRIDGAYLALQLQGRCATGDALEIDYRLFGEVDPTHRGLLRIAGEGGGAPAALSLDPAGGPVVASWPGTAPAGGSAAPSASFFRDGVHHILNGYDHLLFLLCLLLPAVLRRGDAGWVPVARWREAVWPMVGLVSMFTVAHSLTLALAGLQLLTIPPRIVEPAIALTIVVAALDNLFPLLRGRRKLFSFVFGLIHGFGFAGVLRELELPTRDFIGALLQFNLGVEAGQLAVVALALLLLAALRGWRGYRPVVLHSGSMLAAGVAMLWLFERVFDVRLLTM